MWDTGSGFKHLKYFSGKQRLPKVTHIFEWSPPEKQVHWWIPCDLRWLFSRQDWTQAQLEAHYCCSPHKSSFCYSHAVVYMCRLDLLILFLFFTQLIFSLFSFSFMLFNFYLFVQTSLYLQQAMLLSIFSVPASHCCGFSCFRARALEHRLSSCGRQA